MHYTVRGNAEAEPLVLLMGLGADGSIWEKHVQAYEQHYCCYLLDNRGAGRSSKPSGPYSTAMMAADTIGLMQALGIESAHVSGISMGSAIAQEVALAAPEWVRTLTLNCSWSRCAPYAEQVFRTFRSGYAALQPDEFQDLLRLFIYTPDNHVQYAEEWAAAGEAGDVMPEHAFQAQCDACIGHDTTGRLGAIKVPTLITVGDQDIFTPKNLSLDILREIPHARLDVFEGSGHTHHWDQLERFNRTTVAFMRDSNPKKGM